MRLLLPFLSAMALAGCAGGASSDSSTSGSSNQSVPSASATDPSTTSATPAEGTPSRTFSATVLPTLTPPKAPPSRPSDQLTGLWLVGVVETGGDGPCYTFTADDGRLLTLSSSAAGTLTAGDRLKVRILMPPRSLYCGNVEAWSLVKFAPVKP